MCAARAPHMYVSIMAAHVGLDPRARHRLGHHSDDVASPIELFIQGKIDAYLAFVPEFPELRAAQDRSRARRHGHGSGHGPSTSAVSCSDSTDFVRAVIRLRPNARCAPSSRPRTCARSEPERAARQSDRGRLRAALRHTRSRRSRTCPTMSGATSTPRIRCASTACWLHEFGDDRRQRPTRSSPRAPTGAFSTSSSAS